MKRLPRIAQRMIVFFLALLLLSCLAVSSILISPKLQGTLFTSVTTDCFGYSVKSALPMKIELIGGWEIIYAGGGSEPIPDREEFPLTSGWDRASTVTVHMFNAYFLRNRYSQKFNYLGQLHQSVTLKRDPLCK